MVVNPRVERSRLPNNLLYSAASLLLASAVGCAPLSKLQFESDEDLASVGDFERARVYPKTSTPRPPQPRPAPARLFNDTPPGIVNPYVTPKPQARLRAPIERLPAIDQEVAAAAPPEKAKPALEVVQVAAVESKADDAVQPAVATSEKEPSPADKPSADKPAPEKPPEYAAGDWLQQRDRAIAALEDEIRLARADKARADDVPHLETLLRMHCALAGRRDDAVKVVSELREPEQEFWRHQAMGLIDLLGPDRLPTQSRRFAVALKSLEEAESHLAAAGSLALRNLALCRKVQDFGVVERFDRNEFTPNQEVLLYVEVRNFAAQRTNDTFETELQGSFRVLDRSGAARAERTLPLDKQSSANHRRDYYIAYRLYIPSELTPGAYTLELTIEDKKGNKSNNGLLDINVN